MARRICEAQLLTLANELVSGLDKRQQHDLIVFDFSKALDRVPHEWKMDHYGVRRSTLEWIRAFLTDRVQQASRSRSRWRQDAVFTALFCFMDFYNIFIWNMSPLTSTMKGTGLVIGLTYSLPRSIQRRGQFSMLNVWANWHKELSWRNGGLSRPVKPQPETTIFLFSLCYWAETFSIPDLSNIRVSDARNLWNPTNNVTFVTSGYIESVQIRWWPNPTTNDWDNLPIIIIVIIVYTDSQYYQILSSITLTLTMRHFLQPRQWTIQQSIRVSSLTPKQQHSCHMTMIQRSQVTPDHMT